MLYTGMDLSYANVVIRMLSAAVDNNPLMFPVLATDSNMSDGQWLLLTR